MRSMLCIVAGAIGYALIGEAFLMAVLVGAMVLGFILFAQAAKALDDPENERPKDKRHWRRKVVRRVK